MTDQVNGYVIADAIKLTGSTQGGATQSLHYLHTDHLNTPKLLTDSSGQVVWRNRNVPFSEGTPITYPLAGQTDNITQSLRYPGQYHDAESGVHDNWNRSYDPVTGRYLQSDPIGLAGGLNAYVYANNNPVRFIDPSGLAAVCGSKPIEECKVILEIDRGPPSYCGMYCQKINGRFAILTCAPYIVNEMPRCICVVTPGTRG